jgi:hypothetical protein
MPMTEAHVSTRPGEIPPRSAATPTPTNVPRAGAALSAESHGVGVGKGDITHPASANDCVAVPRGAPLPPWVLASAGRS